VSQKSVTGFKSVVSVVIILVTLFLVVFCKMEVRRIGYSVWKQARHFKLLEDQNRYKAIEYAKYVSPRKLRKMAQRRLTLNEAEYGQIIQLSGQKVAIRQ
jgi:hypothetical protein